MSPAHGAVSPEYVSDLSASTRTANAGMPCETAAVVSRIEPTATSNPSCSSVTEKADSTGLRSGPFVRNPASRSAMPGGPYNGIGGREMSAYSSA